MYCLQVFAQLVAALCPSIYGHELVKAGLLLAVAGGVRKHVDNPNKVRTLFHKRMTA